MDEDQIIQIELVYALPDQQIIKQIAIKPQTSVEQAIQASGILTDFPDIDLTVNRVGIFAKKCKLDYQPQAGERIEIYRALVSDPKEVRRRLAAEGKTMGKK